MTTAKSDALENGLLLLIFNATALADIAQDDGTGPLTNIAVALHTGDPGEAGTLSTSEIAYTSYARVDVARSGAGWTVSTNTVVPAAAITFPAGTGGSGTATHFSVGKPGGGAAMQLYHGTVTPNIVCGDGITPELTTATTITEG